MRYAGCRGDGRGDSDRVRELVLEKPIHEDFAERMEIIEIVPYNVTDHLARGENGSEDAHFRPL